MPRQQPERQQRAQRRQLCSGRKNRRWRMREAARPLSIIIKSSVAECGCESF